MRQYSEEEGIRIHDAPPKTFSPFEHWRLPGDLRQSFDIGVVVSFGYFLVRINDTLKTLRVFEVQLRMDDCRSI